MIGKTISHYKILERLGEGGMGVVYKAEDVKLDRIVALKFLAAGALDGREGQARLAREAKSAAALNHPSICTVYEIDQAEGRTFISMEYVEGQSLKEATKPGPMKLAETVNLAIQVAEGLQAAHDKGIVHRDIKPANVMITPKGLVKIMDFGLAKAGGRTVLTKTGTTLGTVAYMSPEQSRGEEVDGRSDIWSLGVMLYELIAGQRPFKGEYEPAVVYSILNDTPEPLTGLRSGVPMDLERIVSRCTEKDRSERYQTAGDLVADLRRVRRRLIEPTASDSAAVRSRSTGRSGRLWLLGVGVLVVAVAGWAAYRHFVASGMKPATGRKMMVVLPFENLGAPEDEYFADGITEEITSRLASVRNLGVISRTSAVHYAKTGKTIREIGDELGVEYVLEGTVRWARNPEGKDRVRITPQLIRVGDDTHLWAERYDRVIDDIFTVQSDIAQTVVEQLGITLLAEERPADWIQPTENLQAYHAYLRGRHYAGQPHFSVENWTRVIENYQRAVEIDPGFALAHAELSKAHSRLFYLRHDLSEERKELARNALERALELAPESPEVMLAAGYYHFRVEKDYEQALEDFESSARDLPESAEILDAKAELYRHRGRWEEALIHYQRACELSPRSASHVMELALTYYWMRRYPEALVHSERAIALAPDQAWPYLIKAFNYWSWKGALSETRETLMMVPEEHSWAPWSWYWQRMFEGEYREAIEVLSSARDEWIRLKIGAWPKSLFAAFAYELMGERDSARASYEEARAAAEKEILATPYDPRYHNSLGIACAALGRKEEAIREGLRAVELYPVSEDAVYGQFFVLDLAHIYAILGEQDAAMDELEHLLSIPGPLSAAWIEMDPRWNPLRESPRFQRLLAKYSTPEI